MRKKTENGVQYLGGLERTLDRNQSGIIDELTHPHSTRLNEMLGAQHRITSKIPAHTPDAQPVQARGRIVWNKAYEFQPRGPSYLDGAPDPGKGGGY